MTIKKNIFCILFINLIMFSLFSQEAAVEEVPEEALPVSSKKVVPVLPQLNSSIIFIEGEEAVSTNFNREPILNYSASGFRTLQLNQTNPLQPGSSYNSDYVFFVEEDGIYELWYGGTPPGHRDELLPSYASPFRYVLDGIYKEDIYREDIHVVEEYAPAYYWNYVKDVTLSAGEHNLKFEVTERRAFDDKYYFYLDNFFLVKKENDQRILSGDIPEVFPKDMDNRSIDSSFLSLEEYDLLIRDNPENFENYVFVSKIYTLIGDNLSALKYLKKASFLEPDNPEVMLLTAKNLIWRGATQEGLELYKDLLKIVPERIDLWTEAGKVAGWIGLYYDSIDFFKGGLKNLPDDLSLLANLGITNLWLGSLKEAEKQFEKVAALTGDDLEKNMDLAEVFRINGYPEKAVPIYIDMMKKHPEVLQLYLDLEKTYIESGQREKISKLREATAKTFIPNPEYNKIIETFYETQSMREKVLTDYEEQLANDPNNLSLRKTLAEIYFWNGYKKKAISEYRNILSNYTYLNLLKTEADMTGFLELLDRNYALSHFITAIPEYMAANQKELVNQLKIYQKAVADLESLKKKNEAVSAKGGAVDSEGETVKQDEIYTLENSLASLIYDNESFIEKYNSISSQFADETENLQRLLEDESISSESFELLLEGTQWKWDRSAMLDELNVVKSEGVILGNFVLGKIAQYEGDLKEAKDNLAVLENSEVDLKGAPFALYETEIWLGDNSRAKDFYEQYQQQIDDYCSYIFYLNDYLDYLNLEGDDELFGYLTGDPEESINNISQQFNEIKTSSTSIYKGINENIFSIRKALISRMKQGFYRLASDTYLLRNELGDFYNSEKMYPEGIAQYKQVLEADPWNLSAKFKLAQVYHWNGDWSEALRIYKEIYEEDPQYNNVASFYNDLTRDFADSFNLSAKTFSDSSTLSFNMNTDYNVKINKNLGLSLNYSAEILRKFIEKPSYFYQNVNVTVPVSFSLFTFKPTAGLYMKIDVIDETGVNLLSQNPDLFGHINIDNFYFTGGGSIAFSKDPVYLSTVYIYDWMTDSFLPGKTETDFHEVTVDMNFNFAKTKIPFIEDTVISLSGGAKFITDGNLSWSAGAQVANNVQILREPSMNLNIILDFIYEDTRDAPA
ncbi:MAG: tetratricopeptide repeat protein, partial [Spirochaetaceae bacterium]|nr:tetratricopeptide repeat protein [Spirochaetaceae bacterium]